MWDNATITMLLEGTRDTLYMTLVSTFFGYVLGLPLGILLAVTDKEGIRPNAPLYKVLDVIVNILKYSVPDPSDPGDPAHQADRGSELRFQRNDRSAGDRCSTVHCTYGRIFPQRS